MHLSPTASPPHQPASSSRPPRPGRPGRPRPDPGSAAADRGGQGLRPSAATPAEAAEQHRSPTRPSAENELVVQEGLASRPRPRREPTSLPNSRANAAARCAPRCGRGLASSSTHPAAAGALDGRAARGESPAASDSSDARNPATPARATSEPSTPGDTRITLDGHCSSLGRSSCDTRSDDPRDAHRQPALSSRSAAQQQRMPTSAKTGSPTSVNAAAARLPHGGACTPPRHRGCRCPWRRRGGAPIVGRRSGGTGLLAEAAQQPSHVDSGSHPAASSTVPTKPALP